MAIIRSTFAPAAVVVAVLGLVGCGNATTAKDSPSTPPAKATTPAAVGVPVTDGKIEFVVNSVTCTKDPMSDSTFAPLPPKGQFCKVNVSATALSNIGMYLGKVTISTAQKGDGVDPAVGAMMYEGTLKAEYIDEGQTLKGDVVFDIATEDSVTAVRLQQSPLTEGVTVPVK